MVVGILGGGNEKNGSSGDWESRIIAGRCIYADIDLLLANGHFNASGVV